MNFGGACIFRMCLLRPLRRCGLVSDVLVEILKFADSQLRLCYKRSHIVAEINNVLLALTRSSQSPFSSVFNLF